MKFTTLFTISNIVFVLECEITDHLKIELKIDFIY